MFIVTITVRAEEQGAIVPKIKQFGKNPNFWAATRNYLGRMTYPNLEQC